MRTRKSIVLVGKGLAAGGAELSMLRLAENFSLRGYHVKLAVLKREGRLLGMLPQNVRVEEIGGGRLSCIPRLARYLRAHRSDVVISFMTYPNVVAILAQLLSLSCKKIIVSEHSAYSKSIKMRGGLEKLLCYTVPIVYRWTSSIVCVSHGVREDLVRAARLPRKLLTTIYNPVLTEDLISQSLKPPDHPWLRQKTCPLILAVGRLGRPKNYPMMLEAFAQLRSRIECRLLILGEGEDREILEAQVARLGLASCVDLAGFQQNAMAFMRCADVFVLASDWEGLSNVLIEAMAVGCPIVSTDAPHGPREVLQDGRLGRLVPVGNAHALADALQEALRDPGDPSPRETWARSFTVDACADQYLKVAGLD